MFIRSNITRGLETWYSNLHQDIQATSYLLKCAFLCQSEMKPQRITSQWQLDVLVLKRQRYRGGRKSERETKRREGVIQAQ